ncbi:hypothetical protein AB7W41_13870 [Providencia stuartii]|uniref:hypothetical protein n=1 Tax=Morganellaceae TaxID=1903414 RepID=UPI0032DA5667
MPSITPLQKAAFDAIDTLHFGQVVMYYIYKHPLKMWLPHILNRINEILQKARVTGKQAEITKHYILAALEIYLSIDDKSILNSLEYHNKHNAGKVTMEYLEKLAKHNRVFSIAMLSFIADKNGVDKEFFLQVVDDLLEDEALELSSMPYPIKYRLAECCYAFEYPDAPLGFYRELVNHNIISCGKYSSNIDKYAEDSGSELSLLFIRAGLLFELRMLQRSLNAMITTEKNSEFIVPIVDLEMPNIDRKNLRDYYKRLIDACFLEVSPTTIWVFQCRRYTAKSGAKNLLEKMSKSYFHKRKFSGTQARWLGTLGAFDIEASHRKEPDTAIYYDVNNSFTISEKTKSKFSDYGFTVSARSLYIRHKEIRKKVYPKIEYYYYLLCYQRLIPWHLSGDFYDDLALKYKEDVIE